MNITERKLKVLVACEESQTVTRAMRELGCEAYSNDLESCSGSNPEWHLKMDIWLDMMEQLLVFIDSKMIVKPLWQ